MATSAVDMSAPENIGRMLSVVDAEPHSRGSLAERWHSLHETAQLVGSMAALKREGYEGPIAEFPDRIAEAGNERLNHAELTLSDIDAILQPGLSALLAIQARGQDTTAPALTLWREFHASRSALLDLAAQDTAFA